MIPAELYNRVEIIFGLFGDSLQDVLTDNEIIDACLFYGPTIVMTLNYDDNDLPIPAVDISLDGYVPGTYLYLYTSDSKLVYKEILSPILEDGQEVYIFGYSQKYRDFIQEFDVKNGQRMFLFFNKTSGPVLTQVFFCKDIPSKREADLEVIREDYESTNIPRDRELVVDSLVGLVYMYLNEENLPNEFSLVYSSNTIEQPLSSPVLVSLRNPLIFTARIYYASTYPSVNNYSEVSDLENYLESEGFTYGGKRSLRVYWHRETEEEFYEIAFDDISGSVENVEVRTYRPLYLTNLTGQGHEQILRGNKSVEVNDDTYTRELYSVGFVSSVSNVYTTMTFRDRSISALGSWTLNVTPGGSLVPLIPTFS